MHPMQSMPVTLFKSGGTCLQWVTRGNARFSPNGAGRPCRGLPAKSGENGCGRAKGGETFPLGAHFPGVEVLILFPGEGIDHYAHAFEFEARDLPVDIQGHPVDLLFKRSVVFYHILGG